METYYLLGILSLDCAGMQLADVMLCLAMCNRRLPLCING
jgi:hypothetical protein